MTRVRKTGLGLLALLCALMLGFGLASCGGKDVEPTYGYGEEGTYYYTESSGEDLLTLRQGTYILTLGSSGHTGTYEYSEGSLTLFEGEEETGSGTMTDSGISLTYDGRTYLFLRYEYYTVTFTDGSTTITTQSVLNGRAATDPGDASKEGYVFLGWYADSSFTERYGFNTSITSDTTVYARFVEVTGTTEYKITYDFGNGETEETETLNGRIYNLPEAEMSGYTFLGWWVSATNSADELTYRYDGETLYEDTTLFAVYASGSYIGASIKDGTLTWLSSPGSQMSVSVADEEGETVASWDQQATQAVSYDFSSLPSGKYTVTVTSGGVTETLTYVSDGLARVSGFTVVSGSILMYGAVENAERYYISIDCSNPAHDHTMIDNGTSLYYDFSSCEMPATGITFTVYAYAEGYYYSVSSYNYFLGLDRTEVTVEGSLVSWTPVSMAMSYEIYIDGTLVATTSDTSYSLSNYGTGTYEISVKPVTSGYYSELSEAVTFTKTTLASPTITNIEDYTITWTPIEGAAGYIVSINGTETTINSGNITSLILSDENYTEGLDEYEISVKALAEDSANDSPYGETITVTGTSVGSAVSYNNGTVTWQYSLSASEYRITVNDGDELIVTGTNSSPITLTKSGNNEITIYFVNDYNEIYGQASITVYAYAIVFDARGGTAYMDGEEVEAVYVAKGDTIVLPEAETSGYVFAGWYTLPDVSGSSWSEAFEYVGDGYLFGDGTTFTGNSTMVLYAFYTPRSYNVTVSVGDAGYFLNDDGTPMLNGDGSYVTTLTQAVYFNYGFTLPRVVAFDTTIQFYGWYSEPNMIGTRYVNSRGESLAAWNYAWDAELYAGYVDVLSFSMTTYEGESVYAVSKASTLGNYEEVTEITVPAEHNGVKVAVLQSNAFTSCKYLEVLNLPDTIMYISTVNNGYSSGSGAFASSGNLREVNIYATGDEPDPTKEVTYYSSDGVLFQRNSITGYVELVYFPYGKYAGDYSIPETVFNEYEYELDDNLNLLPVVRSVTSVATKVFYQNSTLTSVTIPATVVNIDSQAFQSCSSLQKVTFLATTTDPEAVQASTLTINGSAFQSCSKLEEVTLASRLADGSFDYEIFTGCSALQNVYVNSTGTTADNYSSVDGLLIGKDGTTLVYYPMGRTSFEITSASITVIGESAVYGNKNITSVTIPAFVTRICENAFYNCTAVKELVFEGDAYSNDLYIESYAFYNCSALTSVVLPVNLYSVKAYAFGGCSKLTSVSFDARPGATSLDFEEYAFASTSGSTYVTSVTIGANAPAVDLMAVFGYKVTDLSLDASNPNYVMVDGLLYDSAVTRIIYCPSEYSGVVVLPDTVEEIGDYIFRSKDITGIVIPKSVTRIGSYAFYQCTSLTTVTFTGERESGDSLIIEEYAFYGCTFLTSIALPAYTVEIGDRAFYGCTRLTTVTLSEGLEKIGDRAFYNCTYLVELVIPEGTTQIGDYLFYNCSRLSYVYIPSTVIAMGSDDYGVYYMFYGCSSLSVIDISEDSTHFAVIGGTLYGLRTEYNEETERDEPVEDVLYTTFAAYSGEVVIPGTVTEIKYRAFYQNSGITKISFSGEISTLSIGSEAFSGCTGLEEIVLPEGLTTMSASMFANCTALTTITIPSTVTSMASGIFSGCDSLVTIYFAEGGTEDISFTTSSSNNPFKGTGVTTIILPERVTALPDYLFYGVNTLEYVYIPSTVTSLGLATFSSIPTLRIVEFAEGSRLTEIGRACFAFCTSLTEIVLPEGLTTITASSSSVTSGNGSATTAGAFEGCTALEYAYVPSTVGEITTHTFYNCTSLATVEIGGAKDGDGLTPGLTSIGTYAFRYAGLKTFTLPASVTTINNYGFDNCASLVRFDIRSGSRLSVIGTYAFNGCESLESFSFPASITVIGGSSTSSTASSTAANAFKGCAALKSVTFETDEGGKSGLKYIGTQSFADSGLTSFEFPETDTSLSSGTVSSAGAYSYGTVGSELFSGCTDLKVVTLSSSVTSIVRMFKDCTSIEDVIIAKGNENFSKDDALPILYNANGTAVRFVYDTIKNPVLDLSGTDVVEIGDYAFEYQTEITSVILPASVTHVGANAFRGCTSLESVTFLSAAGVNADLTFTDGTSTSGTSASVGVFSGCTSLKTVTLREGLTSMGAYTFYGCSALGTITVPDSATSIGAYAFSNSGLKSITFSAAGNLTEIGKDAFYQCSSLESISIPEGVTQLEEYTFRYDTALTSVTLPSTLTKFNGNYAFGGCTSLKSINLGYLTNVGGYAFQNCTSLETVVLPAGLTTIGNYMFDGCTGLKTVVFEDGFQALGQYMFRGCTSLSGVALPENDAFTSVAAYAFQNCSSLTSITFPSNVTSLGNYAFSGAGLVSVDISHITSLGTYVFQNCASLTSVKFNDSVTSFPNYMFAGCSSLEAVTLPEDTTSLGTYMFQNCTSLKSMIIPAGVTSISNYCFDGCTSLSSVTFLGTVNSIGQYSFRYCSSLESLDLTAVTTISNQAFRYSGLTSVYLPSYTALGGSSNTTLFGDCENLETVILSPDLDQIALAMFDGCTSLTRICYEGYEGDGNVLPLNCTAIGGYAFRRTGLTEITVPGTVSTITGNVYGVFEDSCLESVTIEDGVQTIGYYSFKNCTALVELTIPYTVTSVGYGSFYGCTALESVYFEDVPLTEDDGSYPLSFESSSSSSYSNGIFYGCTSLKEIVLPERTTDLGSYTFYGCESLEEIFIPAGVTNMGYALTSSTLYGYNFYDCVKLETVTFGAGSALTTIGQYTFYNCTSLTDIVLPDTVTSIQTSAFEGCSSLEGIVFPANLDTLGTQAFYGSGLTEVTVPAKVSALSRVFQNCGNLQNIYVETGSTFESEDGVLYNAAGNIHTYPAGREGEAVIPDGCTSIVSNSFEGCDKLTRISIPSTVTSISQPAFAGCTSVTEYAVEDGNTAYMSADGDIYSLGGTTIVQYAAGKTAASFTLPEGVTAIGTYCFYGCLNLTEIVIPESIESLGTYCFYGCENVTEIYIYAVSLSNLSSSGHAFDYVGSATDGVTVYVGSEVTALPNYLFYASSLDVAANITRMVFSADSRCESIGTYTFYYSPIVEIVLPASLTSIGNYAAYRCEALERVFYYGDEVSWNEMTIGTNNTYLTGADVYFYSETAPTEDGNWWHLVNGEIVIW